MAEYYPLLAKAVAGLPNSTPETRRAVYERARKALLTQLQNLQPPVPEADVARETHALDMAVARLETELAAPNGLAAKAPPVESQLRATRAVPNLGETKTRVLPRAPTLAPRPNGAASAGMGLAKDRAGEAKVRAPDLKDADAGAGPADHAVEPRMRPDLMRPEAVRPHAPQPEIDDAPQRRRLWIVIAVVVIIVGSVAAAAWKLRDRPEDFAAFKSAAQSQTDQGAGKIVERVGGAPSPQAQPPQQAATKPAAAAATPAPAPAPAPAQTQTATNATVQKTPDTGSNVPVAYRAALLVEAPEEPNKIKTYVGTVIWQVENVSSDSGQPPGTAVRADVDIPEDKLKTSLEIQKNTDASLSASHTITIVFTIAPDTPTGGIKQISLPQLRSEDSPSGAALQGSLVPIMDNSFLIGLNRGDAETTNINLIKQREWFDIPILLANGRVAKLTFEKNASGNRAIEDALASWQSQQ
jgi:hypothetical protein